MTICEHLLNNECMVASKLVNISVPTNIHACEFCLNCNTPKQLNKAIASITVTTLLQYNKFDNSNPQHSRLQDILTIPLLTHGPGTELKKLISWFIYKREVKDCQSCYNREQQMNQWGPEECRNNISTIVEWLRESAAKHGIPFSETLVKILINKAIRNSEKHYEMVRSSNHGST